MLNRYVFCVPVTATTRDQPVRGAVQRTAGVYAKGVSYLRNHDFLRFVPEKNAKKKTPLRLREEARNGV